MENFDYPAAHSMDTTWFAVDDAGEVACLMSGENGPVPEPTIWQSDIYDLFHYLDKDENGVALLAIQSPPFPADESIDSLQQLFAALPVAQQELNRELACADNLASEKISQLKQSIARRSAAAVVLLKDTADLREFDSLKMVVRLDAQSPLYHIQGNLQAAFWLLLRERILAWREVDEESRFDYEGLAQVHGIYFFESFPGYWPSEIGQSICPPALGPPLYEKIGTPAQPRIGLPERAMQAMMSQQLDTETVTAPLVHHLPGIRFARMDSIQLADFVKVHDWGQGYRGPDDSDAVMRKNMRIIHENPSAQREAQIAQWHNAAQQGDMLAKFCLGYLHSQGNTPDDAQMAFYWYQRAALQADAKPNSATDMHENGSAAQCCLADLYEHGIGVTQDYLQAHYWYSKAAAQNNYVAQYRLGMLYQNGYGVPQDEAAARVWLKKSAQQNYLPADEMLEKLDQVGE